MKHKWHDEIVAWAGGAEIEFQYLAQDSYWSDWGSGDINWSDSEFNYRIKPQPKEKKYFYAYQSGWDTVFSIDKRESNQFYLGKIEVLDD